MAKLTWTKEEDALLRQLWADGVSVKKISETLCARFPRTISRNGVIGRANRLGLPSRESVIKWRDPNAPREKPGPKPKPVAVAKPVAQPSPTLMKSLSILLRGGTAAPSCGYTLEQVQERRGCRWTDSKDRPFLFCGARTQPGQSFCAEHRERVYRAAKVVARPYAVRVRS
jgi:GcrA cell cycle regulator